MPMKLISPQLKMISDDMLIENVLEKISEVDIKLEELEDEHPSIIEELNLDSDQSCVNPTELSINQWNKIGSFREDSKRNKHLDTTKHVQFLSDFIDIKPNVSNKDVGLADIDPEYTPKSSKGSATKVKKVLDEVLNTLPNTEIGSLAAKNPVLLNKLKPYINPVTNKLSKNLGNCPIKFLDELLSEGFINLSKPSENTIEGLIADDEIRKANMTPKKPAIRKSKFKKNLDEPPIPDLHIPDWMLKDLLGIDKQEVIRGLQSIRVPDNQYDAKDASMLPPSQILSLFNSGKIRLPDQLKKDVEAIHALTNSKSPEIGQKLVNSWMDRKASQKGQTDRETISSVVSSSESINSKEIDFEKVKLMADNELHPMLDQLKNSKNRILIEDLPMCLQKQLGVDTPNTFDHRTSNSRKPSTKSIGKDLILHTRRKSVLYKQDPHPSLVPYSLNTVDKIISKCEGKVDPALLETLRNIPNKALKLDKLPAKVLKVLETRIEFAPSLRNQSFSETSDDESEGSEANDSVNTIRVTKMSDDESNYKGGTVGEGAQILRQGFKTSRTPHYPMIDFHGAVDNLGPNKGTPSVTLGGSEIDPKGDENHLSPNKPGSVNTDIKRNRRASTAQYQTTLKNFPKLISAPVTLSKKSGSKVKFDPKPGANFSRRFSRGDSIPGFIKVEPIDKPDVATEETKEAPVLLSSKTVVKKRKIRQPKDVSGLSDRGLIGGIITSGRRNTFNNMMSTKFQADIIESRKQSNPFA